MTQRLNLTPIAEITLFGTLLIAPPLFQNAAAEPSLPLQTVTPFTDVTKDSGVAAALTRHYQQHSNWWLSGLNLVDLDGDGKLYLFFASHGAGVSLALLNDGHGHFTPAAGLYPPTEIHLPYDINEDGKL